MKYYRRPDGTIRQILCNECGLEFHSDGVCREPDPSSVEVTIKEEVEKFIAIYADKDGNEYISYLDSSIENGIDLLDEVLAAAVSLDFEIKDIASQFDDDNISLQGSDAIRIFGKNLNKKSLIALSNISLFKKTAEIKELLGE
jgi:hypothetical protein